MAGSGVRTGGHTRFMGCVKNGPCRSTKFAALRVNEAHTYKSVSDVGTICDSMMDYILQSTIDVRFFQTVFEKRLGP